MKPCTYLVQSAILLLGICVSSLVSAEESSQVCIYKNGSGQYRQANSPRKIPQHLRKSAKCFAKSLAKPEEIELKGNTAREKLLSSLGEIDLRWPRTVERLFGRNPIRAMTDAAQTVSRAIRTSSFPVEVLKDLKELNVVFLDENLPKSQIPKLLVQGCHPGWMTPPGNIYVAAQRVAEGCHGMPRKTSAIADSDLTEVLVHELGHVVDFHLLKDQFSRDRMRAEGFATWFTLHAARYSSFISQSQLRDRIYRLARQTLGQAPGAYVFMGGAEDYARAAMYFVAIEKSRGVKGIVDTYSHLSKENVSFFAAVGAVMYWDRSKLEAKVEKLLR